MNIVNRRFLRNKHNISRRYNKLIALALNHNILKVGEKIAGVLDFWCFARNFLIFTPVLNIWSFLTNWATPLNLLSVWVLGPALGLWKPCSPRCSEIKAPNFWTRFYRNTSVRNQTVLYFRKSKNCDMLVWTNGFFFQIHSFTPIITSLWMSVNEISDTDI